MGKEKGGRVKKGGEEYEEKTRGGCGEQHGRIKEDGERREEHSSQLTRCLLSSSCAHAAPR